jgi:heme exporter protein A
MPVATAPISTTSTKAPAAEPVVEARKLRKSIDDRTILRDINLRISAGEYVALLGANGAGKSTLLRVISTLTTATSGEFCLFGKKVTSTNSVAARARIGMIGHQSMLYRDLSACENLEFYAKLYGIKDAAARAKKLLDIVGLIDRANDPVKSFSRGMQQRVAIARALVHNPELILADEPFAGLDAPSTHALELLLSDLSSAGKTIILVNHDIEQTLRLAERVIVLRKGTITVDELSFRLYPQEVLSEVSA